MSFSFKQFHVDDSACAMKVGTDGVLLGAWADTEGARRVLDAGAGSGLVALMTAQRNPDAIIDAVEIDPEAAEACKKNVEASPWSDRITVHQGSFEDLKGPYDLIISNPPFYTEDLHSPDKTRARARHAGELSPMTLVAYAAGHLSETGNLAMITPTTVQDELTFECALKGLNVRRLTYVSSKSGRQPHRLLWQISRKSEPCTQEREAIADGHDGWTEWYARLTEDFYLKLPKI